VHECLIVLTAENSLNLFMVHKYSAAALARRRQRALALGFLAPAPPGSRHVLVPTEIAPRIKTIAKSLNMHQQHNALASVNAHYARSATMLAARKGLLSDPQRNVAMSVHRAANRAKHAWAPIVPVDPLTVADPWAGASLPCRRHSGAVGPEDPWWRYSPPSCGDSLALRLSLVERKVAELELLVSAYMHFNAPATVNLNTAALEQQAAHPMEQDSAHKLVTAPTVDGLDTAAFEQQTVHPLEQDSAHEHLNAPTAENLDTAALEQQAAHPIEQDSAHEQMTAPPDDDLDTAALEQQTDQEEIRQCVRDDHSTEEEDEGEEEEEEKPKHTKAAEGEESEDEDEGEEEEVEEEEDEEEDAEGILDEALEAIIQEVSLEFPYFPVGMIRARALKRARQSVIGKRMCKSQHSQ